MKTVEELKSEELNGEREQKHRSNLPPFHPSTLHPLTAALAFLLLALPSFAQGPGFNPVRHMAPRPPQCWVDAKQFIEAGAADRTIITTQLVDYSGHGFLWGDGAGSKTNVQYLTRLTGCISSMFAGSTEGLQSSISQSNDCQTLMFTGPGSDTLRGKHTNQCTIAVRLNYRTGDGGIIKSGNHGTPRYAFPQFSGGVLFWDFYSDALGRMSKTIPGDLAGNWVNIFFTRSITNQDIWMGGPTGPATNWHTARLTGLIYSGSSADATPGKFTLFGMTGLTNWYVKRTLFWDYQLPPADIEAWHQRMKALP